MKKRITITQWNKLREEILNRDNYTCQICNRTEKERKLLIHHEDEEITGESSAHPYTKNNDPDNLITLCNGCHVGVHRMKPQKLDRRLLKIRNQIYKEIWEKHKDEFDMKDLSKILKVALGTFYRVVKNRTS